MDKIIKEIEELLKSDVTDYRISKDTGITLSVVQNYRNGKYALENMTLKIAKKLYEYKEKINMTNYGKMMVIVNELVLEDGASVDFWFEDKPNNITTSNSVEELKSHLGHLGEDDYEKLIFQVNFDDENLDRNYQFYFSEYEDVVNKNEFVLSCLHNTR
nr:MAG TPA: DNA-binding protein [Caudoviricetes sp.]